MEVLRFLNKTRILWKFKSFTSKPTFINKDGACFCFIHWFCCKKQMNHAAELCLGKPTLANHPSRRGMCVWSLSRVSLVGMWMQVVVKCGQETGVVVCCLFFRACQHTSYHRCLFSAQIHNLTCQRHELRKYGNMMWHRLSLINAVPFLLECPQPTIPDLCSQCRLRLVRTLYVK